MGYLFALLSGIAAGTTVATGKLGGVNISALSYVFFCSLISGLVTFAYLLTSRKVELNIIPKRSWGALAGHVVASFFAMWAFWEGTKLMNAAVASFLVRTEVVFIILLSVLFLGERFRRKEVLACLIILAGAFAISEGNPVQIFVNLRNGDAQGIGFILLSAIAFGVTEFFSKKIAAHVTPLNLVLARNILLSAMFGATGIALGQLQVPNRHDLGIIAISAIAGPLFARLFFMHALRTVDLGKASLFGQVEPFFAALLSLFLFHDIPTARQWLGGTLIITGCVLIFSSRWGTPPVAEH